MKDSVAGVSNDAVSDDHIPNPVPTIIPSVRQNVPAANPGKHNKRSINGIAGYLADAACHQKPIATVVESKASHVSPSGGSSERNETNINQCHNSNESAKCKPQTKPKSDHNSQEKDPLKKLCKYTSSNESNLTTKTNTDKLPAKPSTKMKFGEKFLKKDMVEVKKDMVEVKTPKQVNTPKQVQNPNQVETPINKVSPKSFSYGDFSRDYKMRSRSVSTSDSDVLSAVLRENSSKLNFVDVEWPVWCPRRLQLLIKPDKKGKPARFKLEQCGSKRRKTESSENERKELEDEKFTVSFN